MKSIDEAEKQARGTGFERIVGSLCDGLRSQDKAIVKHGQDIAELSQRVDATLAALAKKEK